MRRGCLGWGSLRGRCLLWPGVCHRQRCRGGWRWWRLWRPERWWGTLPSRSLPRGSLRGRWWRPERRRCGWWRRWSRRSVVVNRPRRLPHRWRRRRGSRWRGRWGAELEDQPGPMLRIAKSDRSTVVDEDRRHPHPVDVDPAFAPIDGDPLAAVVMQHHLGGCAVDADVRATVASNGHISAGGKGVFTVTEPDDQGRIERFRRHGHPPSSPFHAHHLGAERPLSTRHDAPSAD